MSRFTDRLAEIWDRCKAEYTITPDEREFVHNAYWNGSQTDTSSVLDILCWSPDPQDLPVLLDASSPSSWWVHRCNAAQAFGGLDEAGRRALLVMHSRETHPIVRFWIMRELVDLGDDICLSLLDGPIPSRSSPGQRALWIYGNFQRGELSKEKALKYLQILMSDPKRRTGWLLKHIEDAEE